MAGTYCAGQIINCIMSIYDIHSTNLHKWEIMLDIDGGEVYNLLEEPTGRVFDSERASVHVTSKL